MYRALEIPELVSKIVTILLHDRKSRSIVSLMCTCQTLFCTVRYELWTHSCITTKELASVCRANWEAGKWGPELKEIYREQWMSLVSAYPYFENNTLG